MSPVDLGPSWGALDLIDESVRELRAREIDAPLVSGRHAFVAIDWEGFRHLLIPMSEGGPRVTADRGRGIRLARRVLVDEGESRTFLDVACLKPHLHALFDVVAAEMLDRCETATSSEVPAACRGVLEAWRELLDQLDWGEIPLATLAGAWGELWFVRELLRRGAAWTGLWQGPAGSIHDIVAPSGAHLEVKSTTARGPLVAEIHGLGQLDSPASGTLFLGVLRLRHGPDDGESTDDIVRSCVDAGAVHAELIRLLAGVGVNPAATEFTDTRFAVAGTWLFAVAEGFPRVVPASFLAALPAEVTNLTYQLDLTGAQGRALGGSEFDRALQAMAGAAGS